MSGLYNVIFTHNGAITMVQSSNSIFFSDNKIDLVRTLEAEEGRSKATNSQ